MNVILTDKKQYVLRFDKGEEVFSCLQKFLIDRNIGAAYFSGIGACDTAELALYDKISKSYQKRVFNEQCEILSLTGNSAVKQGQVVLHAHAVLSRHDFSCVGGHVIRLVISATCEMFLVQFEGTMERKLDEETNLNLLC